MYFTRRRPLRSVRFPHRAAATRRTPSAATARPCKSKLLLRRGRGWRCQALSASRLRPTNLGSARWRRRHPLPPGQRLGTGASHYRRPTSGPAYATYDWRRRPQRFGNETARHAPSVRYRPRSRVRRGGRPPMCTTFPWSRAVEAAKRYPRRFMWSRQRGKVEPADGGKLRRREARAGARAPRRRRRPPRTILIATRSRRRWTERPDGRRPRCPRDRLAATCPPRRGRAAPSVPNHRPRPRPIG